MIDLRDPDMFGMYIYNDYHAYGILEVLAPPARLS